MLKQTFECQAFRLPLIALIALLLTSGSANTLFAQDEMAPTDAESPEAGTMVEDADGATEPLEDGATEAPVSDEAADDEVDESIEPEAQLGLGAQLSKKMDDAFGWLNGWLAPVLFYDISFGAFDSSLEELREQRVKSQARVEAAQAHVDQVRAADETEDGISKEHAAAERTLRIANLELQRIDSAISDKEEAQANGDTKKTTTLPLIVALLALGGLFFTLRLGFINLRLFGHSFAVIRGKYDNPNDHGEISHFQALTSALSATVGLGNIAGVAIAISMGGPGAVFWMWIVAFLGMSSKFCSCTLSQLYRDVTPEDGKNEHVLGGPMLYLSHGIKQQFGGGGFGSVLGKSLAILFAIFTICGSLGGGNMFQGNQTFAIVADVMFVHEIPNEHELTDLAESGDEAAAAQLEAEMQRVAQLKEADKGNFAWVGGLVLTVLVGVVIIGGIKRIGEVTSKLVPTMCVFYCGVCLVIVIANIGTVPTVLREILTAAFTTEAMAWGGIVSVFVFGVTRGVFSNEAGLGSAAIAHSAAKTNEPVREGIVAMIGPFIDTILVCTMTSLAILITDAHLNKAGGFSNAGIAITANAFSSLAPWLKYLLTIAVFVFAYSTMISWSYYGERACEYLFGRSGIMPYRVLFLIFVFLGPMMTLENVLGFTDIMMLSMAYPNIIGLIILSPVVAKATSDYIKRLKSGEMKPYDPKAGEDAPSI